MAGLATGSTQSRMTQPGHGLPAIGASIWHQAWERCLAGHTRLGATSLKVDCAMQGNEHCIGTFPYIKKRTNKINTGGKDFRFLANTRQPQRSEIHRSIPWPTTRIQPKSNRAKRSLESSITTQAKCPEKPSAPIKMSLNNPTLIRYTAVISNKEKSNKNVDS